ncbi:MAG: carboxypeptidase regulatory-like domain-containing protein [Planctomycetota bacterium]|jgi:peroxiredoxin
MRTREDIERSIKNLDVATTDKLDERILGDAAGALDESLQTERAGAGPGIGRRVLRSRMIKLAAAAIVIAGALIGYQVATAPKQEAPVPEPAVTKRVGETEFERIVAMLTARDVDGLTAMLSEGKFKSKVLAAMCLGEIGDARALPELWKLYLEAEEKLPEGYEKNPFAGPIEKIEKRIKERQLAAKPKPDIGEVARAKAPEIETTVAPSEAARALDFLVVDKETGRAMGGVRLDVKIQRDGPDDEHRLVTDGQGRCRIELGKEAANYVSIRTSKDDFVPMQVSFRKGRAEPDIPKSYRLALERATSIGGFIQNEEGEPIEEAEVYLSVPKKWRTEEVAISDHKEKTNADGFWRCDIVPAKLEDVRVRLSHPDYIDDEYYGTTPKPPIENLRDMTGVMVMHKGVDVFGRVIDLNEEPIEGAEIVLGSAPYGSDLHYPRTKTDHEGRFQIGQARPGTMVMTAKADGYAPDLKELGVREEMEPVELRLGPAQTIRGRVIDSADNSIGGAQVVAQTWRGHHSLRWRAVTDSGGFFEWNNAPQDEVGFYFHKEGYADVEDIPLSPSTDEHIIEMYRAHPLQVSGTVADAESKKPIKDFRLIPGIYEGADYVSWAPAKVTKLGDGRYEYRFTHSVHSSYGYVIRVEAEGYLPGVSPVFKGDEGEVVFDFALKKGKGPVGVVYLPNGEPAVGAEVALFASRHRAYIYDNKFSESSQVVKTGVDGQFSFPAQAGAYLVVALADEGYAEIGGEDFEAAGEITLLPWGRVDGLVQIGGQPSAYEIVSLSSDSAYSQGGPSVRYSASTRTDGDGRFVLDRVAPGKARLLCKKTRGGRTALSVEEPVEVIPGQTVSVTIGVSGRPVLGQLVMPADYAGPANWAHCSRYLILHWSGPPTPEGYEDMTEQEKQAWLEAWESSDEGKAFRQKQWQDSQRYYPEIEHDGTFQLENVPVGTHSLRVVLWEKAEDASYGWEYVGSLNHIFEVTDVNDATSDVPLDIGTLELETKRRLEVGDVAEPFDAETFDGRHISIAEHSGKVVLLNFWRSEDLSSTRKLLDIEQAYKTFSEDTRIIMVAVTLDDDLERAAEFVEDKILTSVVCIPTQEAKGLLSRGYGVSKVSGYEGEERFAFPYLYVIGPDGRVLARNPNAQELETILDKVLGR